MDKNKYDHLAALLEYPQNEWRSRLENCRQAMSADQPEAITALEVFASQTDKFEVGEMQELFTHTFDSNPTTALEVGWHLFGENYNRGAFLVHMRGELRKHSLEESAELPDHLTHVLAVLGRMDGPEAGKFATTRVLPALERMRDGVKKLKSPYENILTTIWLVLTACFGPANAECVLPPVGPHNKGHRPVEGG